MEFTEMEKRMLYQTEGSERYAVLQEMSMASRYAGDPARRKAAKSLLEKLRPLTDAECMEAVHDIREYQTAKRNVDMILGMDENTQEKQRDRNQAER